MFVLPIFRIYEKCVVENALEDCVKILDRDIHMKNDAEKFQGVSIFRVLRWKLPQDYYHGFVNRMFSSESSSSVNSFLQKKKNLSFFAVPVCTFYRIHFPENCSQKVMEEKIKDLILEMEALVLPSTPVFYAVEILDFFSSLRRQELVQRIKTSVLSHSGFSGHFYLNFITQTSHSQLSPLKTVVKTIQDALVQDEAGTVQPGFQKGRQFSCGLSKVFEKPMTLSPEFLFKNFFRTFFMLQIFALGGKDMACSVLASYFAHIADLLMNKIVKSVPELAKIKQNPTDNVGTEFLKICLEAYLEGSEYPEQSWQTRCAILFKCVEKCRQVFCFSPKAVYFLEPFLRETQEEETSVFLEKFSLCSKPFLPSSGCTGVDCLYNSVEKNVFFCPPSERQRACIDFFWAVAKGIEKFKTKLSRVFVVLNVKKLCTMYQTEGLLNPVPGLEMFTKQILEQESYMMCPRESPFTSISSLQKMDSFLKKGHTDLALEVFEGTSVPLLSKIIQQYHETFPDLLNCRKKIGVWSITYIFTVVKTLNNKSIYRYPSIQKSLEIFLEEGDSSQNLSWNRQIVFLKESLKSLFIHTKEKF